MKQPFAYYGGKQRIASKIIPYIPRHTVYVEPFCGGATIYWKMKQPEIINIGNYRCVLNDTNKLIVNFFRVCQDEDKIKNLIDKLDFTLYSREEYKKAKEICKQEKIEDELLSAWAFFVNINFSFSNKLNQGFGYNLKTGNSASIFRNKVENIKNLLIDTRLKYTTIENLDALEILEKYDSPQTFFYLDPPYPGARQGHYKGYTIDDYKELLEKLKTIKGSFILSCYAQGIESENWKRIEFEVTNSVANIKATKKDIDKKRTEVIWIVDNGGGIEQEYFKKIYSRLEFQEIWPFKKYGLSR